jgi:hypothetical protein
MTKPKQIIFSTLFLFILLVSFNVKSLPSDYSGKAFKTQVLQEDHQVIPGIIQCEYFDKGGEGIAYHDMDATNNGSGNLNKGTDFLSTFRLDEGVDISFTKFYDSIDNSAFNFVQPKENQLYVGWTEPGEWINFTVEVKKTGLYKVGMMYTSNGNGQISFSVNGEDKTGPIDIVSTHVDADPLQWRQWHHWNYMENIAEIRMEKGLQVLTLHTVTNGQMNYDFISFDGE